MSGHHRELHDQKTAPEEFGLVLYPEDAEEPILAQGVRGALSDWLVELRSDDELRAAGLKPRKRALFTGLPGIGKTTLAHHLAARLQLPLLVVSSDALISPFVGQTDRNIAQLFDVVAGAQEPVIVLIDEFDNLGLARNSGGSGADDSRNSMVNTLLRRIERYEGFLIAATNRGELLDPAIWRRFDLQIKLQLPGPFERQRILARYLAPYELPDDALREFAQVFTDASPSLIRQFCEGLKRTLVLGPRLDWDMTMHAVLSRLLVAVAPPPGLPVPRLWKRGADDPALESLPWPLPLGESKSRRRVA